MARIIVADDDDVVGEIARETLSSAGHVVGLATNGKVALQAIWLKKPDLVVLDCNMPELSGLLVLRRMRDTIEFHHTPVLMLTGRRSRGDLDLAMFEGASDYMKKPFEPDELLFRVDQLLARPARRGGAL